MDEQQVRALLDAAIAEIRKTKMGKKKPDYYHGYRETVEMATDLAVHALGNKPDKLLDRKVPNETPEQRAYREAAMEPFTLPYWSKAENAIKGRIWNESNFVITKWDEETEQFKYFMEEYDGTGSIVNYFRSVRLPIKLYDANAVMCVKPKYIPVRLNDDDEYEVDDTQQLEAITIIYEAKRVISFADDHAFIKLDEKSVVQRGGQTVREGLVFEVFDDENIWRIEQVGEESEYLFEVAVYYEHGLGYMPAWRLQGIPRQLENGYTIYQSYFLPALADLNTALFDESTLNIAKISHIYPERWEVRSKCTNSQCEDGKVYDGDDDDGKRIWSDCPSCSGSGYKPHPLNSVVVSLPDRIDSDSPAANPPTPPFGYAEKDIQTPKFLREEIDRKKRDAFANLNLDITAPPNGQTATESKIDREELFSMLLTIASEEFDALAKAMEAIGAMMWGSEWELPNISPPTDFTIRSYAELTQEISDAREQKLPMIAFKRLIEEYIAARYTQDNDMTAVTALVFYADRLVMSSDIEVNSMLANQTASKTEAVIHTSIFTIIDQLLVEDEDFLEKPIKEQKDQVIARAQEIVAAIPTASQSAQEIGAELGLDSVTT